MSKELEDKFNYMKSRSYQKSNHEGLYVCYEDRTFLKLYPKNKITISEGDFYLITRQPKGLIEESLVIKSSVELHNQSNYPCYCVLKDSLFNEEETETKLIIKKGMKVD